MNVLLLWVIYESMPPVVVLKRVYIFWQWLPWVLIMGPLGTASSGQVNIQRLLSTSTYKESLKAQITSVLSVVVTPAFLFAVFSPKASSAMIWVILLH